MKSNISKIQTGFLVGFVVISVVIFAYQVFYVWPVRQCEERGDWWDEKDGVCAVPLPISQFTGRKIDGKLVIERGPPHAKP